MLLLQYYVLNPEVKDMLFLRIILVVILLILLIRVEIKYKPRFDLVKSRDRYKLLLWYNKYDWIDEYYGRTYINLFYI